MQMHQVHTELCIIRKRKNASVHGFVPAVHTEPSGYCIPIRLPIVNDS